MSLLTSCQMWFDHARSKLVKKLVAVYRKINVDYVNISKSSEIPIYTIAHISRIYGMAFVGSVLNISLNFVADSIF